MKLYGRNSISERLKADPKSIKRIFVEKGADVDWVRTAAKKHRIPLEHISINDFQKKSSGHRSQGAIAEAEEFRYTYLEDILVGGDTLPREKVVGSQGVPSMLLFLDNLNDPQNLGGILRIAACLGGFAVVLPRHDSVEVTEAVLRVAQGGENYVPVARVANLSVAVEKARKAGYWIAGAVTEGGEDITKTRLNFPLGIVIGSEGKGIRQGLVSHLDLKLTLPMAGAKLSFNAAVAAALFCYEITRQKIQ
jgi:23S rRNA (guanosine2251-2'-O)-methyltransferase